MLKLEPYPARAAVPSTITLVAVAPDGRSPANVSPVLSLAAPAQVDPREFQMQQQSGHSYIAHGVLFPQPGPWRIRVDVHVGDSTPASMLTSVDAR
jgi:hypothetical protein